MYYRSVFIFAVVGLILVSSLEAAKPAKGKPANPEESSVIQEIPAPKIYRPKTLKVVTAYDKCKMECQRIRDNQDLHSYAAQLREELAAAEAVLEAEGLIENTESVDIV